MNTNLLTINQSDENEITIPKKSCIWKVKTI